MNTKGKDLIIPSYNTLVDLLSGSDFNKLPKDSSKCLEAVNEIQKQYIKAKDIIKYSI